MKQSLDLKNYNIIQLLFVGFVFGLNLNVSIFIKPISKIGWYQENLSYFLTGLKIFVSDKGSSRPNQMLDPAKVEIKCRKSRIKAMKSDNL